MHAEGTAGAEKPKGEVGEICFSGPQIFLGYLGDPENTAKTVSKEGICYTGDVGHYDDRGLHFCGRAKLVNQAEGIPGVSRGRRKPHPREAQGPGLPGFRGRRGAHEVFSEAIMAFVECLDGKAITPAEVMAACEDIYGPPF
jgi:fatty-acyl-CoA synthase